VHTVDPHSSYRAPDLYHRKFSPGVDHKLGGVPFLKELQLHRNPVPPDLPGKIKSLYDSTVAFLDAEFAKLVHGLKRRGLYDETLIIFVSDHGEEFYEHGNWEHGKSLYSEVIHVPLIIRFPDGMGLNAASVDRPASHVDIVTTVLAAVGLVAQHGNFGRNLSPSEVSSQSDEVAVFSRVNLDGWVGNSVAYQGWKLIEFYRQERSTELFNLTDDPQEMVDLFDLNRVRAGFLLTLLRKYEAKAGESIAAATAAPDDKLIEELKALGYLQ
jgi:arylsulfatase A-like enzyme